MRSRQGVGVLRLGKTHEYVLIINVNKKAFSKSRPFKFEIVLTIFHQPDSCEKGILYVRRLPAILRFRRRRYILFGNALAATQGLCADSHSISLSNYFKAISKQQCLWPQLQMSSSGNYPVRIGSTLLVLVCPY